MISHFIPSMTSCLDFLRDEVLKPNNYKKLMMEIMNKKEFNIKEVKNTLWLSNKHLKREIESDGHIIGLHSNSFAQRKLTT